MTGRLAVKGGKYYVVISYKDENGKYKNKWVATGLDEKNNKRAATDMMRDIVAKYESGVLSLTGTKQPTPTREETDSPLFSNYLFEWLRMAKPNLQQSTYSGYLRLTKVIAAYFEEKGLRLDEIKPKHIQEFYTYLQEEKGKSKQVCHHYHIVIHRALQIAYRSDMIQTNPADKIERPKFQKHKAKFYTAEQVKTLFKELEGDPYEHIYKLTAIYGMRRSEVGGLRWSSIDFEKNTLTLDHAAVQCEVDGKRTIVIKDTMKNQSSLRTLPLLPVVRDMLLKLKAEQQERIQKYGTYYNPNYLDYVCVDGTGNLIRPDTLTTHFKTFLVRHNLPVIRLHELRHSCASILIACGVSMKAVQEWLGHSTFSTTADIYSHLNYSSKLGIAETLSDVFSGKPVPVDQTNPDTMATIQKIFYASDIEAAPKVAEPVVTEYESWDEDADDEDGAVFVDTSDSDEELKDEPIESVFPELPADSVSEFKKAKEEMKRLGFETLDEYFEYLDYKARMEQRKNTAGSGGTAM
ncbi:MAG: site-specific integrase [Clostridia bacterium]|nr:site-specific integrase [Clostridia bacterium]